MAPTERLYLTDDSCLRNEAKVLEVREGTLAFDRSCFYPGGGGQPPDQGIVLIGTRSLPITSVAAGEDGVLWHATSETASPDLVGQAAILSVDPARRDALTRYHTVLHVLNTIALRDYNAWITGAQIGVDYSRIDFRFENFSAAICPELEAKVNAVLEAGHTLRAYTIPEEEFRTRPDLLRTLQVSPPVVDGRVRVVEISGFDAQACGGTHAASTSEVGRFSITRTENKGKINKRLYVQLSASPDSRQTS